MPRYRAVVSYDGTDYQGFQVQPNAPTIQGTLEAVLKQVSGGQQIGVIGAGRTDAGVHATGQVIAFELDWKHDDEDLLRAVNATLPTDIALQRLERANADFHPRFDATSRTYHYLVYEAEVRQPIMARTTWWVKPPRESQLDLDVMNQTAAQLLGSHDFASFGSPPQGDNTVREVYQSVWAERAGKGLPLRLAQGARLLSYCIEANAFLYHQVRTTVAALVEVGLNRMSIEAFIDAFQAKERGRFGKLAPPNGLTLTNVSYKQRGDSSAPVNRRRES